MLKTIPLIVALGALGGLRAEAAGGKSTDLAQLDQASVAGKIESIQVKDVQYGKDRRP